MSVFSNCKNDVVLGTEKRSAIIFGKAIRPKVFGELKFKLKEASAKR